MSENHVLREGFPGNGSHPPAVPLSPRLAAALESLRVHHEAEVVVPENRLPWNSATLGGENSSAGRVELAWSNCSTKNQSDSTETKYIRLNVAAKRTLLAYQTAMQPSILAWLRLFEPCPCVPTCLSLRSQPSLWVKHNSQGHKGWEKELPDVQN